MADGEWEIDYRPGWARARRGGVTAWLQLGRDGGRPIRVMSAVISPSGPVAESAWRTLPLGYIEKQLEVWSMVAPDTPLGMDAAELASAVPVPGFDPDALRRWFEGERPLGLQFDVPADALPPLGDAVLEKSADGRLTDAFLTEVGALYARCVAEGRSPAPVIAKAADASQRTVHGWIGEARNRGIMAPGRKGKAG